jgi:ubiquinone biosynthesis UbiH/UbiF/VisC/COQ6 family hydroxylase
MTLNPTTEFHDIIIVGAGPAGLAFARALDGTGLSVALVERQPAARLADPAPDGREIALTQRSVNTLRDLGAWAQIDPDEVSPLRAAFVLNGESPFALSFDRDGPGALGQLVPNHLIRKSLYAVTASQPGLTLITGAAVAEVHSDRKAARVTLADGRMLEGRLLVAADSRLSDIRTQLGIDAEINPLGKSMLVCRVEHSEDHQGIATEWFGHGQTIAMLPLNGRRSGAVLTLDAAEINALAALDREALGAELTRRYAGRLGPMTVVSAPHVWPLTITWSHHFAATRAALIGDAAVGMHPVTAHGFNFGLSGAMKLAGLIRRAAARGGDIAAPVLLRRYEAAHRVATRPLYEATRMIVGLYTDERLPARLARPVMLRAAARLPLVRQVVTGALMR